MIQAQVRDSINRQQWSQKRHFRARNFREHSGRCPCTLYPVNPTPSQIPIDKPQANGTFLYKPLSSLSLPSSPLFFSIMPEASPKARQARRRTGLPKPMPKLPATPPPSSRRRMRRTRISRRSISGKILPRFASEPVLLLLPWSTDDDSRRSFCLGHNPLNFSSAPQLPLLSPSTPSITNSFAEEAKVVVSVTVEGSPGPVRAMVRLGATVEEAIGVVVDRYGREGRSPHLDRDGEGAAAAGLFQLHHSHFSLQSLNKSDKIGEVGGRSFYLRRSSGNDGFTVRSEGRNAVGGSEIELVNSENNTASTHIFFSFIAQRLRKFKRRTGRLWRILTCITCCTL